MDKNKTTFTLTNIKEQFLNHPLYSRFIPIALSVWILSLTVYYCIDAPWLSLFSNMRPDTKQLIADTLKFHWVPIFLSRLPYVFYAIILNFIAMLMGNRILRWLKVDFDSNINKIIFSVPLGWGIYSIGIFYLGVSGLLYKEAVYCFLTLLSILSILEIKRFSRGWKSSTTNLRLKIDKTDLVFLPIIFIFITAQLVIAFSPVWTADALAYHMALPKLYIKHHSLVYIPGSLFSTLPAHTEMLYLLGLITSGETLSKLFSFSISLMFLFSIFSIGNRYFSKGTGYLAVVIMILGVPSFSYHYHWFSEPWVDAAFGLFLLLGMYAFFMWIEERKEGHLYLSIICCASAAATKTQGLFFVLLFFAGFLVTVKMDECLLKKLARCILVVSVIALPWYIRSWWLTGNPVFPFLYSYLGGRNWNDFSNACFWEYLSLPEFEGAKGFSDFIKINKVLFFSEIGTFYAFPFIIIIFLIPALITLGIWNRLTRYLFFITFVYYIFFVFTSPQSRFFYMGLAALCIIVAYFIKTVWTKYLLTRIPIILCIVSFSSVYFLFPAKWIEGQFFTGLGVLDQRQFLNGFHLFRVFPWVNENLPENSKILSWLKHGYHLDRRYLLVNPTYQGILNFSRIKDAQTFLNSIKELGITHLLYYHNVHVDFNRYVKEFLDRCVSELLEGGKITKLKQIDDWIIYSVMAPPDYFVLNSDTIRFYDESQRKYLVKGWYSAEKWGTWSEGEESLIMLNFGKPKDYTMLIKATGFSVLGKQQSIRIYLDDNLLGEHTFTQPTTYFEDFEIKIPSAYIKEGNQRIRFVYGFTGSPAEHGMGSDARQLAMGVSSIEFK